MLQNFQNDWEEQNCQVLSAIHVDCSTDNPDCYIIVTHTHEDEGQHNPQIVTDTLIYPH